MSTKIDIEINVNEGQATSSLENVKKSTDDVAKSSQGALDNFGAFGVTIGGLKSSFAKVIPTAKAMFGTIKAGLISTGIGAFLVAIGSLVQYFSDSEEGASRLKQITTSLGVAFGNVTDIVSDLGKALFSALTGDFDAMKEAFASATDQVKNFGKNTKTEMQSAIQLEKDRLALQKFEREAIVDKAKTEARIMELRLKARDREKFSNAERLKFMREANALADEQLKKDLHVAEEKLRFQQVENSYSKSTKENLDAEAQLQAQVFQIQRSNFSERKRMKSEEQALASESANMRKKEEQDRLKEEQDKQKAREKELAAEKKLAEEKQKLAEEQAAKRKQIRQQRLNDAVALKQAEIQIEKEVFNTIQTGMDVVKGALKEGSKAQRAVALAELGINTTKAIASLVSGSELAAAQFSAATGPAAPFTYAATKIALYTTGLAQIMGNIQQARSLLGSEPQFASGGMVKGWGDGTSDSISARLSKGESIINAKSTRMFKPMLSAMNVAGGGVAFAKGGTVGSVQGLENAVSDFTKPQKAFVVTDEMTNSQKQLASIRRKATI